MDTIATTASTSEKGRLKRAAAVDVEADVDVARRPLLALAAPELERPLTKPSSDTDSGSYAAARIISSSLGPCDKQKSTRAITCIYNSTPDSALQKLG